MFTKTQVSQSIIDSVAKILKEDDCVTPMQSKKIADKEVEKHEKHMHKGKKPTFEEKKMEEDKLKETGFHMAAHAAKKAGQPHFTFQGKKYPTTAKSTAEAMEEGWDDMMKAVRDKAGPQPSGGSGVKQGHRYGGSKQKEKPEHDEPKDDKMKKEETEMDFKEKLLEKNWIAGAIKKPGAETAAAKKAGMSVQAYAHKHAHDAGKAGKRARLAITLGKMHKEERDHEYSDPHMAINQLRTIMTNTEELLDMLGDTTDLPEWVESKITLAEDYIMTVANYMRSELKEEVELDEMDKSQKSQERHGDYPLGIKNKDVNMVKPITSKKVKKDTLSVLQKKFNQAKAGKMKEEVVEEGMMDTVKKVGGKVLKTLGHGSDADMRKDLQRKMGVPQTGEKPKKEAVDRGQATTDTLAGRVKGGKDNEHSSIKVKLKAEAVEKHDDKPPFDGPYTKAKGTIKDKSGALHTPMSRARDLAKTAMKKVKKEMMIGKAGGTSE